MTAEQRTEDRGWTTHRNGEVVRFITEWYGGWKVYELRDARYGRYGATKNLMLIRADDLNALRVKVKSTI